MEKGLTSHILLPLPKSTQLFPITWTTTAASPDPAITCFAPTSIHSLQTCSSVWPQSSIISLIWEFENCRFSSPTPQMVNLGTILIRCPGDSYTLYNLEGFALSIVRMGFLEHSSDHINSLLKIIQLPPPKPSLQVYGFIWHKRPILVRLLSTFPVAASHLLLRNAILLKVSLFTPGFLILCLSYFSILLLIWLNSNLASYLKLGATSSRNPLCYILSHISG